MSALVRVRDLKLPNRFATRPELRQFQRKNNDIVAAMYAMYLSGPEGKPMSLAAVGRVYRKTRQAVYDQFKARGYQLRTKQLKGLQILDGIRFTLTKGGYLRGSVSGRRMQMHTYVWEKANGTVPAGHGIHHRDFDRTSNRIENLELLTIAQISSKHNPHLNQFTSPTGSRRKKWETWRRHFAA